MKYNVDDIVKAYDVLVKGIETKANDDIADAHLYKQAGNSVSVRVVERIAEQIYKTFLNENNEDCCVYFGC